MLGFGDYASLVFATLSTFTYILGNIITGYFWTIMTIKKFILSIYGFLILSVGSCLLGMVNPYFYLVAVLFHRFVNSSQFLMNDLICFGLFNPF